MERYLLDGHWFEAAKNNVLWAFAFGEPDEWVNRMVTYSKTLSDTKTKENKFVPLTKGELIQKVGEEEALRNIAKEKYHVVYESDDDEPKYVKKNSSFVKKTEMTETLSSTRHCQLNQDHGNREIKIRN